ncbi:MAG: NADH:flavin oxidoreductase [Acidobacteriota bacterium]|nr:NADH:flavin oxidoreductase [Acidobacteriota bacterium]MDE3043611.1 NADH:flavin oxidoreductase [Acidobacteriota bacterium]MDE3106959.1 NADH:flavin oxidoreductase [Acidobacteriota bacterium]MDE3222665.1 NADH:flavin oxidoreductase [Acidobacteriota bacterium]
MTDLFAPLTFRHGPTSKNRFMLAPLTNQQSHDDGTLSDHEYQWLTARARGDFGVVSTCAAHVQASGQGFPGQLGIYDERHVAGLTRLATGIKEHGALALVQLHHAGLRAPTELTRTTPVAPFDDPKSGARALTTDEVEQVVEAFVVAAHRAKRAGFDGVELHGAHNYLLCEFIEPLRNTRADRYGGSFENRCRVFFEIIDGVRARCGDDFHLAIRLSPERFAMSTSDVLELYRRLVDTGAVDLIDLSLWDVFKEASDENFLGRKLLELFTAIDRGDTRLAAAGKIYGAADARRALDAGLDLAVLGRAAITNHDFPRQTRDDPDFSMRALPVTEETLTLEGVGPDFVTYLRGWPDFVAEVGGVGA